MIKSNLTLICILLFTKLQTYQSCGIGCLSCSSQHSQPLCLVCDEKNYFFLRNGSCFKNYDKFCTKYQENGNCLQCSNNRAPDQNDLLTCKMLNKNQKVEYCKEYSGEGICAVCGFQRFLNGFKQCQEIDTYIDNCQYYQTSNTCQQCLNNFHLSVDQKKCIKSKVDNKCAVQQNLKCLNCKNHFYQIDQNSYSILDNSFLNYYQTQNLYISNHCSQILNKIDYCERYNNEQQCILCEKGYFLQTQPIVQCKSIDDDQSSNLIENCIQLQTQDTCYKCAENYHPSLDRTQCFQISQQPNCKIYSTTLNGSQPYCEECNDQYFMKEDNICQFRTNYPIESCQKYSLYKDQCLDCGQNQLSDTKDYCIQTYQSCILYQSKQSDLSISKCASCQDPYIVLNGICSQGNVQNCQSYDQITKKCVLCKNQYYLTTNSSQQQVCLKQLEISNCDIYYNNLQETEEYSCQFCKAGFLIQNIVNKCILIVTENCDEEDNLGQCIKCQDGYEKVIQNEIIKCIEKLDNNLQDECQQTEIFQNHIGWEDYNNHHCLICNENYIPRYLLGQCVAEHIASQRQNFVEGCISFDEDMKCQLCEDQLVLHENQCLSECPDGTVLHKNYIDIQTKNLERNFKMMRNICIQKVFYDDEYLQNCDIRTRRAYTLLDIINREYCQKCDNDSIATIGHSFYRINLMNSQFDDNKPFDEFLPLIKCEIPINAFNPINNCEYYGQLNEFDDTLVCKRCKHGFRENFSVLFTEQHIQEACEDLQGNNCLQCKQGYYIKYFDSIGGNACYLPKDYYQDCSEQIPECLTQTYQQVPGDLVQLISCQKCQNGKVPVLGVKQMLLQNSEFNYEFSEYLFTHQALPFTNKMIECISINEIESNFNTPIGKLDSSNTNGFQNCAIFGINRTFQNQSTNNIYCLACKPGFHTPNKSFRSDVCEPIQNCEIAGNRVNSCEKLYDNYFYGVQQQFYEMPNKIYHSINIDKNCAVSFQDRGCIVCKKGYEIDESLQCVQISNSNCQQSNYNMPTLYLERNQINLLTFMQTSDFGFGCYKCQSGFVAFNEGFRKQCISDQQYRPLNRFNPLIDQGVQENVFIQHCLQYQLQDNLDDQLLRGNDCIKCQQNKNLINNKCEDLQVIIQNCLYYVNGQCVECQQGNYYLQNGQCYQSNVIENCIEYSDQFTCTKCQNLQNQQYHLVNNQCKPKYICTEEYITTDYVSVQNNFFNGLKCDQEFRDLNIKLLKAYQTNLEVIQCKDGYKVDNNFSQQCLPHSIIQNCIKYDQSQQRHLVFDLKPNCIQCNNQHYLNSNNCLLRNNMNNCQQFEVNSDSCKICNNLYYLYDGQCKPINDINCDISVQNQNACQKCKQSYILNESQVCELYHFNINYCLEYSNFGRYCAKCQNQYYLQNDNLNCQLRQNYTIDNCNVYSLNQDNCLSCKDGFYLQDDFLQCIEIQTFVENCERPLSLEKCHECEPGYSLQNDQTQCDYIQTPLDNCLRYIDQINCYECQNNAQLYDNKCYIPDQNNCLKYQQDICETCANGYSYDSSTNTCIQENYELFCQQCVSKKNLKCSQHCQQVENCEKMTWYGKCEKCNNNYILSYDQSRCYYNTYDIGCELLVETEPFCRTCQNGYKEYELNDQILCLEDESSNCVQRDSQGRCQMCKPGSYQTVDNICQNYKVGSDEQSNEEDNESSQSSNVGKSNKNRLQFILKDYQKLYFFVNLKNHFRQLQ